MGAIVTDTLRTHTKCFTCKYQGSLPNLLRYLQTKKKNVDYSEIIAQITKQEDYIPEYEERFFLKEKLVCEPLEYADLFEPVAKYPDAMRYLANRGVSDTTARKLGLGFHPEHNRIVFPVKDRQGRTYGFTGRKIREDDDMPKILDYYFPKSMFLLGTELWEDQPSILVEGLFAFAHLHEITKGKYFPYNIGAIMGSSISDEQVSALIKHSQPVYCLLDNDRPGQIGTFGQTPKPDWSFKKREEERMKGMAHKLAVDLRTFTLKWPIDPQTNTEKIDPDHLNYDELCSMLLKPRAI